MAQTNPTWVSVRVLSWGCVWVLVKVTAGSKCEWERSASMSCCGISTRAVNGVEAQGDIHESALEGG